MLYNGVIVYPSTASLNNVDSPITVAIFHSGSDKALLDMIEMISHMHIAKEIFVLYSKDNTLSNTKTSYPFISFMEFEDFSNRFGVFNFALEESKTDYFLFLDSSYDLSFIDSDALLKMFSIDERTVSVAPFLYTNKNILFPTCTAPRILKDGKVDSISLCSENKISANLYPFLLVGMYKKSSFELYKTEDKYIKTFDCHMYDVFAHLWMMNYRSYIVSFFKVKSNLDFVPIIDRTITKEVRILSSRILSFYKPRGAKCGLKPFWWLSYSAITVVKEAVPFLKKVVVDFYTLVKRWKFSLIGTNDLF